MNIRPIRTKREYKAAPLAIEPLMRARRNTPEGDILDVPVKLVEDCSKLNVPFRIKM